PRFALINKTYPCLKVQNKNQGYHNAGQNSKFREQKTFFVIVPDTKPYVVSVIAIKTDYLNKQQLVKYVCLANYTIQRTSQNLNISITFKVQPAEQIPNLKLNMKEINDKVLPKSRNKKPARQKRLTLEVYYASISMAM
ncbi:LOW QUALITY PROTEIN: hypothetical protein TorRG33x02_310740, partial [Trema orientale]